MKQVPSRILEIKEHMILEYISMDFETGEKGTLVVVEHRHPLSNKSIF